MKFLKSLSESGKLRNFGISGSALLASECRRSLDRWLSTTKVDFGQQNRASKSTQSVWL